MIDIQPNVFEYQSPPSRAAWIEILPSSSGRLYSVSPPSRAAWIEINAFAGVLPTGYVAAFTGGVD